MTPAPVPARWPRLKTALIIIGTICISPVLLMILIANVKGSDR